jgi:predicted homoserine dehydrogenase-like protein
MTPVDGDQPSLLMGLATWAEMLGFTMVAAGKSSEYDFVFDEKGDSLQQGRVQHLPQLAKVWSDDNRSIETLCAERLQIAAAFPQRTVPDLCEMLVVANAVDFRPDN